MKIITWNCNGAFRKKAEFILEEKPDILIVQECEHPDKLIFTTSIQQSTQKQWFGKPRIKGSEENKNKGLGIFSYGNYSFEVLENNHNKDFQIIIPIAVSGGQFDFNLFAIWANNPVAKNAHYVEQVWKAINHYETLLTDTKTILIGDFNSNKIWDRKSREGNGNHSDVVDFLEKRGIYSSYHLHHKQKQGTEKDSTFYMQKNKDKPYHIDYCFVSSDFAKNIKSVDVGDFESWINRKAKSVDLVDNKSRIILSDHVPVSITYDNI